MYFINIRLCMHMMFCVGVHPQKRENFWQKFIFSLSLAVLLMVVYLVLLTIVHDDTHTMSVITGALESIYLLVHGVLKLTGLYLKHKEILELLDDTTLFWKIEDEQDEGKKAESLKVLRVLKTIFYYFVTFAIIPTIFFCFRPFLLKKRLLAFNSYVPSENSLYILAFLLEDYAFLVIYFSCIAFDAFFATLIILAKVQFSLLNQEIKRILEIRVESEEDRRMVQRKTKKCIDYHNFLLRFVEKINDTFSNVVLIYFGILVFSMCVEMFIISNRASVKELIKCVTYMGSLTNEFIAFYCIPAQLLTCAAEEIRATTFSSNSHENLSKITKCTIIMLGLRGNKDVYICAGKFVQLGMRSCLSTYRTIFSYYMFLMTIQEKADE